METKMSLVQFREAINSVLDAMEKTGTWSTTITNIETEREVVEGAGGIELGKTAVFHAVAVFHVSKV